MGDVTQNIVKQAVPILVSAAVAAGLAFAQSLAAQAGFCPALPAQPATIGLLGGIFKATHSLVSGLYYGAQA